MIGWAQIRVSFDLQMGEYVPSRSPPCLWGNAESTVRVSGRVSAVDLGPAVAVACMRR